MSNWQTEQAERNKRSLARLSKGLPEVFPPAVLTRALSRAFIPPTPRLAIDSYWRAHPLRADRLARALAARSRAPKGWRWQLGSNRKSGLPITFRTPPAPYREHAHARGPGFCCVCGQPVYRFGWHVDLWDSGANKNATWHCACVIAWQFWNAPSGETPLLRRLQVRRYGQTGGRLWKKLRSITACHCFEFGVTTAMSPGRNYSVIGDYRTFKSLIVTPTPQMRHRGAGPTSRIVT